MNNTTSEALGKIRRDRKKASPCFARGFLGQRRQELPRRLPPQLCAGDRGNLCGFRVCFRPHIVKDIKPVADLPRPMTLHRSQSVGGKGGEPFEQKGGEGVFLTGFAVQIRDTEIAFLQPIYSTPTGRKMAESGIGHLGGAKRHTNIEGKDGYAIGGLMVWSNRGGSFQLVRGIRILFMRRSDRVLDPKDSYWSEWIGSSGKGQEVMLGGDGKPIIGIHGRTGGAIDSLGIIQLLEAPKERPVSTKEP